MKDKTVIPEGVYCYDGEKLCPYWSVDETKHCQENGYCSYLEKGDWQINSEAEVIDADGNTLTSDDIPFPISLLWDQCKECNVNMGAINDYF